MLEANMPKTKDALDGISAREREIMARLLRMAPEHRPDYQALSRPKL